MDTQQAVQELVDKAAIADVAVRYCELIDSGRWDELDEVFVDDAEFHLPDGDHDGLDAIRSRISGALGPLDHSQHLVSNHQVSVDGDAADHRCYFNAQHVRHAAADGPTYVVAGRYDDRLVRTERGWRITDRTLTIGWTEGNERVLRP